jgi:hypothetical protein
MVLLTVIVGLITIKTRFVSVQKGSVKAKYYRLMAGQDVPENITKTTRNFNNQFEIPVLFYVICTLYISLNIDSLVAIVLAWLFVFFRYLHSYIHLTYNHILHRLTAFILAFLCVIAMWINLLILNL